MRTLYYSIWRARARVSPFKDTHGSRSFSLSLSLSLPPPLYRYLSGHARASACAINRPCWFMNKWKPAFVWAFLVWLPYTPASLSLSLSPLFLPTPVLTRPVAVVPRTCVCVLVYLYVVFVNVYSFFFFFSARIARQTRKNSTGEIQWIHIVIHFPIGWKIIKNDCVM